MIKYHISKGDKSLSGDICLPFTKSISCRILSFRALRSSKNEIKVLPHAEEVKTIDDTIALKTNAQNHEFRQAIRYIRAFFNYFKGEWVISGIEKSSNRPVETTIKKLNKQGVNVRFEERQGYPPLKVVGKNLKGYFNRVEGIVSSEIINASLYLNPTIHNSLVTELKDQVLKASYIEMSLKALHLLGVNTEWKDNEVLIEHTLKDNSDMTIEADWSAASYWYEVAAFSDNVDLSIQGLNSESLQNDSVIRELFENFGVKTHVSSHGIRLTKIRRKIKSFEYDFSHNPDIVQTMAVTCVVLKIPFRMKGINSLRMKYTDRIKTLQSELSKLGATLTVEMEDENEVLCFNGKVSKRITRPINISTYEDHRIVMAFSPIAVTGIPVVVENPMLTSKSYPAFWDDLKKTGFTINQEL